MARPVALITGIAGFAGSWLAEELLSHGYRVVGTLYEDEPTDNLDPCRDDVTLLPLDILQPEHTRRLLEKVRPDFIFHLAAIASVSQSFQSEHLTYRVNFEGTLNLLSGARKLPALKKFVFVGSCDAYGLVTPRTKTLTEDDPFHPISPYGISKAAAEYLCFQYVRRYQVPIVVVRAFNHSGPRQAENFVIPDFARQIAAIDLGQQKPIMRVGNLTPKRDFSDVRDIVRGYRLAAEKGQPGRVYQLCSGRAVSIEAILNTLIGFTPRTVKVTVDRTKLRQVDIPVLRGSNRRAVEELGFVIQYSLKHTLRETFYYWRQRLTALNRKG